MSVSCTCETALACGGGGGGGGGGGNFVLCDCRPGGTAPFLAPPLRFPGRFAA